MDRMQINEGRISRESEAPPKSRLHERTCVYSYSPLIYINLLYPVAYACNKLF